MVIHLAEQAESGRTLCVITSGFIFYKLKASFAVNCMRCGSVVSIWQCTLCPQVSHSEHPS